MYHPACFGQFRLCRCTHNEGDFPLDSSDRLFAVETPPPTHNPMEHGNEQKSNLRPVEALDIANNSLILFCWTPRVGLDVRAEDLEHDLVQTVLQDGDHSVGREWLGYLKIKKNVST